MGLTDIETIEKIDIFRTVLLEALYNTYNKTDYNFCYIVQKIINNDKKDYLSFSLENPVQVSYSPPGIDDYDVSQRNKTKLGRYLRRTFKKGLDDFYCSDSTLDTFVNNVLRYSPQLEKSFELVTGHDIVRAYLNETGKHTCMTGGNKAVGMYAHNKNVRLLIYRHIRAARALVWTCDDGTIVMDRIYPNDGSHIQIMQNYAEKNGWVYRENNNCPSGDVVYLSDDKYHSLSVVSKNTQWPYMDTFRFGNINVVGNTAYAKLYNVFEPTTKFLLNGVEGNVTFT